MATETVEAVEAAASNAANVDVGDGQFEEKQLDGLVRARAAKGLLRPRECAEDERRRGGAGCEKLTLNVRIDFPRLATFFDDPYKPEAIMPLVDVEELGILE